MILVAKNPAGVRNNENTGNYTQRFFGEWEDNTIAVSITGE
jgi:hypothetical protein